MKRFITVIITLHLIVLNSNAQKVYNEIMAKAKAIIETPSTVDIVRQINLFKIDALNYLMIKMREQMPDSTTSFLDQQAYAMNKFVNTYFQVIVENADKPESLQIKTMKKFMDASYSNPLFNDSDTELTLGYYLNAKCLARFSLDTDWRKACLAIECSAL